MLPEPAFSFTIPSIRDDFDLECRLYHPTKFENGSRRRGAIVAHPYAPLGGCFDDPIVSYVASELLKSGFIVGTFNFRGAGGSKGHTTWTAKAETDDYVSFLGFLICYLHSIGQTSDRSAQLSQNGVQLSPIRSAVEFDLAGTLILGGYSYGSLIAMSLPPVDSVLLRFENATKGSAEAEIRLRATHMSSQWSKANQTSSPKNSSRGLSGGPSGMLCGGEESEPGTRRVSRESRRSVDVVRRRQHNSSGDSLGHGDSFLGHGDNLGPAPRIRYLLVSPLLPPIASLITMFSGVSFLGRSIGAASVDYSKLHQYPTLAVYGDKDAFTSSKKLNKWAEELSSIPGSLFRYKEVKGAGHFWHEQEGVDQHLRDSIGHWIVEVGD